MSNWYEAAYTLGIKEGMSPEEAAVWAESQAAARSGKRTGEGGVSLSESPETTETSISGLSPLSGESDRGYLSLGEQVMRARTLPPLEWVIPSLLPVGSTLFVGPEKVGKSFAALDMAFAVASGGRAMGHLPCPQGRSLYIALEDHITRIVERLKSLEPDEREWPFEHMSLTTSHEATGGALSPVMERWYADGPNPRLVIIDTLGVYKDLLMATERGKALGRKGAYDADVSMLRPIHNWAHERRLAVVFVHHTNQAKLEQGESWMKQVSGTTGLTGTVDQTMLLRGERGSREASMLLVGRDMPDSEYNLHRVGPWWQVTDAPRDAKLGDRTNDIVAFVTNSPVPVSPKVVAEALGLDNKYVGTILGEQVGRRVGKAGRGLYEKLDPAD